MGGGTIALTLNFALLPGKLSNHLSLYSILARTQLYLITGSESMVFARTHASVDSINFLEAFCSACLSTVCMLSQLRVE